ncbi:MAG TPA: ABC transporter permease [Lautropia sp.]|jgi:tungstate transport system permease protein|nr:ABC transporter permease [Lautropia sp.]
MTDLGLALRQALALATSGDPAFYDIVALSLQVSGSSAVLACLLGIPAAAWLAVNRFRGRALLISGVNVALGVPSVVVGLAVYLLLSRSGPMGFLGILFTPAAMVVAQTMLIAPMVTALALQVLEDGWGEYRDLFASWRVGRATALATLVWDCRFSLVTVALAAFGRAIAEVGAVMTVGGNIAGSTRVMTTAIALETSKGDLPLALGLGIVLLVIVFAVMALGQLLQQPGRRRQDASR